MDERNQTAFVRHAWVDQVEERMAQEKKKEEEEKIMEDKRKSELALQEQVDRAFVEERKAQLVEVKHALQCQLDLLK